MKLEFIKRQIFIGEINGKEITNETLFNALQQILTCQKFTENIKPKIIDRDILRIVSFIQLEYDKYHKDLLPFYELINKYTNDPELVIEKSRSVINDDFYSYYVILHARKLRRGEKVEMELDFVKKRSFYGEINGRPIYNETIYNTLFSILTAAPYEKIIPKITRRDLKKIIYHIHKVYNDSPTTFFEVTRLYPYNPKLLFEDAKVYIKLGE